MRTTSSIAAFTAIMILPLQCFAHTKEAPSFASAAERFTTPLHCAVFAGTHQSDSVPASYAADMATAVNAGIAEGLTSNTVIAFLSNSCAKEVASYKSKS